MSIETKSRHRAKAGGNVFLDLGFPPKEAKRLLAHADAQIDESIRLKQQLMDEIAEWMKEASVTQAAAAEVLHVTRPRVSDVINHERRQWRVLCGCDHAPVRRALLCSADDMVVCRSLT
jgi:predicted XRE-type DNA-binding protein